MSVPRYEISTLADFALVPADRLADCLADFHYYVGLSRALAEVEGCEVVKFTWIDDDIRGISEVNIYLKPVECDAELPE